MSATTAVTELLQRVVRGILLDPAEAEVYSQNPSEYLAAYGVADHDLSEVDMRPIVVEAAKEFDLPESSMALIDGYDSGEPNTAPRAGDPATSPPPARAVEPPPAEPPAGMSPLQSIEQHINYATYVCHETNTDVVQNLVDNNMVMSNSNVPSEVDGAVYGDIDLTDEAANGHADADRAMAVDDASVHVDVEPGGERSGGPEQSGRARVDDPGFGRGETSDYPGSDRSPGDESHAMPGTRDDTREHYDDGYDQPSNSTGTPPYEPAPADSGYEDASPAYEDPSPAYAEAAPTVAERPLEAVDPIQDVRAGRSGEDMDVMD